MRDAWCDCCVENFRDYRHTALASPVTENVIAINPKVPEILNIFSDELANAAIIAPTIITDEIALVTDIKGVCKDGVTLQTT